MQYKINEDDFGRLSEDLQKEYTQDGDNYVLNIEGDDAPTMSRLADLEKKRGIEAEHRKNAEKREKEAADRAAQLQKDLEGAKGDESKIEQVRKDYQAQLDKLKDERAKEQQEFKDREKKEEIRKVAEKISQKFTVPDIMVDQIAQGLNAREVDGKFVVHPVDTDGKESLETVADYEKRILDKPEWKAIIKVDSGSGGGASGNRGGGASGKKWSEMSGEDQVKLRKTNPERANVLMKAEGFEP